MKWTGNYIVNANDIDMNFVVTVSNIFRYMQDAANSQMEQDGPSYKELFDRGLAFVLSRMNISLYAPLHSHEKIVVESWAVESKGVTFPRCYRILRDGMIIAEAVSAWALTGVKDKKLHRVNEFDLNYGTDVMLELDMPVRMKIPEGINFSLVGERTVEYADTDMNGHMNNTKYPDMICGFIGGMKGQRVISMALSFVSEAPLGETLKIYHGTSDGVHYIRTLKEDGKVNIEAEIITEAL